MVKLWSTTPSDAVSAMKFRSMAVPFKSVARKAGVTDLVGAERPPDSAFTLWRPDPRT
jgi:hypothetical protein